MVPFRSVQQFVRSVLLLVSGIPFLEEQTTLDITDACLDQQDNPITDATVLLYRAGFRQNSTGTDAAGQFQVGITAVWSRDNQAGMKLPGMALLIPVRI